MTMPSAKTTWIGLLIAVLTFATAYLGNDKYQASQIVVEAPDVITNVKITSLPAGTMRSNADIESMINKAVEARMEDHLTKEGRH